MSAPNPIIVSDRDWQDLIGIQTALDPAGNRIGLNCYGLVREVYQLLRIDLPERQETTLEAATLVEAAGCDWLLIPDPEPYAVALIRSEGSGSHYHLAIVTPELDLLHALPHKGVVVSRRSRYQPRILGFYRYAPGRGERLPVAEGDAGRIIGMVLITVAAIAVAVMAGPAAAGLLGITSKLGIGLVGAFLGSAVSVAGNLVMNAVAPIKTDLPQISGWGGDLGDSRSYTWDGVVNDARQGLVKPMLCGRIKVGGQIISEVVWLDGAGNEYLDMLFCPVAGRITRFLGIRINDTGIEYYKNTAAVFRPGDDEQRPIDMFSKIYLQYGSAAKLPYDSSPLDPADSVRFTTKGAVTGVRLTVTAPNGIYQIDNNSNPVGHSVSFAIQYRVSGTSAWAPLPVVNGPSDSFSFIVRAAGVFTGSANPRTLTDAGARFTDNLSLGQQFQLGIGATTYYCTQVSTLTSDVITFNAYTDSGRTTPISGALANGPYHIIDATVVMAANPVISYSFGSPIYGQALTGARWLSKPQMVDFRLLIETATVTWARVQLWANDGASGAWHLWETWEPGTAPTVTYDLDTDSYVTTYSPTAAPIGAVEYHYNTYVPTLWPGLQFAIVVANQSGGTLTSSNITVRGLSVAQESATSGVVTIEALANNPMHLTSRQIDCMDLPEAVYDFRLWRTTVDQTATTWQDDVYLRGYAEIIDRTLAYPGHAVMGVRAMGTDRLYGGRPTVTSIGVGEPLSVPVAGLRYDTTCAAYTGAVTVSTIKNGVVVTGMHALLINTVLPAPDGKYFWLVRMDSPGYAQPDRLLTKFFMRIHTWEIIDAQTRIYIESSETIPVGTPLMLFHEDADPYLPRRLAWFVAKILIAGSHGRITENNIDWASFADWDAWNMQLINGVPRHLCDAIVDFSADLWSIAFRLAATGRGILMGDNRLFKVMVDRAATHRQVFGAGNSANFTLLPIPRSDRANILVTSFLDETDGYTEKPVSREDVRDGEFPIVKTLPTQIGVTRSAQAVALLDHMLAQNRYIGNMCTLETGANSIEVEVGDCFIAASQAKDLAISGRIYSVNLDGTCTLDQPFTPDAGITYSLKIWATDGNNYEWQGVLAGEDITTIPAPAGIPHAPQFEYPYILSKLSETKMTFRCLDIKTNLDTLQSVITGMEYRDEVYADD